MELGDRCTHTVLIANQSPVIPTDCSIVLIATVVIIVNYAPKLTQLSLAMPLWVGATITDVAMVMATARRETVNSE